MNIEDLPLIASVLYENQIYGLDKGEDGPNAFWSLNLGKTTFFQTDSRFFKDTYHWKELPWTQGSSCEYAAIQGHKGKIYLVGKFSGREKLDLKIYDISKSSLDMIK